MPRRMRSLGETFLSRQLKRNHLPIDTVWTIRAGFRLEGDRSDVGGRCAGSTTVRTKRVGDDPYVRVAERQRKHLTQNGRNTNLVLQAIQVSTGGKHALE